MTFPAVPKFSPIITSNVTIENNNMQHKNKTKAFGGKTSFYPNCNFTCESSQQKEGQPRNKDTENFLLKYYP